MKTVIFDILFRGVFLVGRRQLGLFEYLSWEYHQNNIIFRPTVPYSTDMGVNIKIPIFWCSIFVKVRNDILKYFQNDTKYLVYWPATVTIILGTLVPKLGKLMKPTAVWLIRTPKIKYNSFKALQIFLKLCTRLKNSMTWDKPP